MKKRYVYDGAVKRLNEYIHTFRCICGGGGVHTYMWGYIHVTLSRSHVCIYIYTLYHLKADFISFESRFSALQDSSFSKSRAEHPFCSSGHIYYNIIYIYIFILHMYI